MDANERWYGPPVSGRETALAPMTELSLNRFEKECAPLEGAHWTALPHTGSGRHGSLKGSDSVAAVTLSRTP